jgi:hypothetical protein
MKIKAILGIILLTGFIFFVGCKSQCDCTNCVTEECCTKCATEQVETPVDSTGTTVDTVTVESL